MDLEGTGDEGAEWIHLTQNVDKFPVRVSEEENFFAGLSD
jgi:hypothetical protein